MEYTPATLVQPPDAVEAFIRYVRDDFPEVQISTERGGVKAGNWWIDFHQAQENVTVEWRPDKGFGIYSNDGSAGYGDRPREVLRDPVRAARRVVQRLEAREQIGVKELREIYSISQVELANRLGINQASVSKFEERSSNVRIKLDTLLKIVSSLGGTLEIHAHFPDGDLPILLSEKMESPGRDNRPPESPVSALLPRFPAKAG